MVLNEAKVLINVSFGEGFCKEFEVSFAQG